MVLKVAITKLIADFYTSPHRTQVPFIVSRGYLHCIESDVLTDFKLICNKTGKECIPDVSRDNGKYIINLPCYIPIGCYRLYYKRDEELEAMGIFCLPKSMNTHLDKFTDQHLVLLDDKLDTVLYTVIEKHPEYFVQQDFVYMYSGYYNEYLEKICQEIKCTFGIEEGQKRINCLGIILS